MSANPHAEHLQELLEGLNEPQREAVTHGEGPLLIVAGAGSGKTRVLTHRIAFLIYTDQAQAGEILAITFTNKAATEMRERVERLLGRGTREMVADVYDVYERDLHRMNAMDFDDLLFRTVNLLELFEDARERYASTFAHVLVDEYQDTNHAQYRLLQLLTGGGREAPVRGRPT